MKPDYLSFNHDIWLEENILHKCDKARRVPDPYFTKTKYYISVALN
jgi:hypothetical protein